MMPRKYIGSNGPNLSTPIGLSKRKVKEISMGLNELVGEFEGGLPLPGSPALCSAPKCREQLANLRTVPLNMAAVDEVVTQPTHFRYPHDEAACGGAGGERCLLRGLRDEGLRGGAYRPHCPLF